MICQLYLLKKYKSILHDITQQDLIIKKKAIQELKESFIKFTKEINLHYPSFGFDNEEKPIQPEFILSYNKFIKTVSKNIEENR